LDEVSTGKEIMSYNQIKINRRIEPAYRRQALIDADLADKKTDLYSNKL